MISSSKHMFELGASFNYYLIHGGTNFGFWNGAEVNAPVITSYDFSAPISESGDVTPAYLMIRSWIKTLKDWENTPQDVPENNKKIAYGDIKMEHIDSLWKTASDSCQKTPKPRSFEQMDHAMGFMVYTTKIDKCGKVLSIPLFKDFAYIFMDSEYVDTLTHLKNENTTELKNCKDGAELSILVENHGRQTYETINDYKGILSDVLLDGEPLTVWTTCTIKLGRSFVENVEERLTGRKSSKNNHAENLEKEVSERTKEFIDEKKKSDLLLHRMLPKQVAKRKKKLKLGQSVEPEGFDSVTVFFSDVVGFPSIASRCTPLPVETIGDGYLCVSGLPHRNGKQHIKGKGVMEVDRMVSPVSQTPGRNRHRERV